MVQGMPGNFHAEDTLAGKFKASCLSPEDLLALLIFQARIAWHQEYAATDPALYRTLRDQITRFFLRGGASFSEERLARLAEQ